MAEHKVGDPVWYFDSNRRVYRDPKYVGSADRGPIWREHWRRLWIVGETRVSWLVGSKGERPDGRGVKKVPKKGTSSGWAWSETEIDELEWRENHRWKIERLVSQQPPHVLREIAALIGYKETE